MAQTPFAYNTIGPILKAFPAILRSRIARTLAVIIAGTLLWFVVLGIIIVATANKTDQEPAETAVVLGAAVWNNRPSPVFRERINHAINLYRRQRVAKIFFTGGLGKGDQSSAAQVGASYAIERGVDPKDISFESTSSVTLENLQNFRRSFRGGRVLVVSDPLHMPRSILFARDLGLDAHPSPTPTTRYKGLQSQLGFLWREVYLLTWYLLVSRIWWLLGVVFVSVLTLRWRQVRATRDPSAQQGANDTG